MQKILRMTWRDVSEALVTGARVTQNIFTIHIAVLSSQRLPG